MFREEEEKERLRILWCLLGSLYKFEKFIISHLLDTKWK